MDQTCLREDLERKREIIRQGRALATIPEDTEGGEEGEALEMEELEDLPTQLSGGAEEIMTQETALEPMVKEEEVGEETESLTLIYARNFFNDISCLSIIWTVKHCWPSG